MISKCLVVYPLQMQEILVFITAILMGQTRMHLAGSGRDLSLNIEVGSYKFTSEDIVIVRDLDSSHQFFFFFFFMSLQKKLFENKLSVLKVSSVQFSCSVVSYSLWSNGLQHAKPPWPSPTPRVYPNSCPLSWWCHYHIILCHPLFFLPSIFPRIRVFSNESAICMRWPKYWGFSFNISPSNEHSGLISFRMDWLDILAVQGTLKSLLKHHSS